jgi:hypothetical protein
MVLWARDKRRYGVISRPTSHPAHMPTTFKYQSKLSVSHFEEEFIVNKITTQEF